MIWGTAPSPASKWGSGEGSKNSKLHS